MPCTIGSFANFSKKKILLSRFQILIEKVDVQLCCVSLYFSAIIVGHMFYGCNPCNIFDILPLCIKIRVIFLQNLYMAI